MNNRVPIVGVIVVAAGSGTRLGADRPKAFVDLAGRSVLERSLSSVFGMQREAQVVVVAPADLVTEAETIAHHAAGAAASSVSVVAGGASRQQSVALGLAALREAVRIVLVHDAARALTPATVFDAVVTGVAQTASGIVPGVPVQDTVKRVDEEDTVVETVDRSELRSIQTPQGFPRAALDAAYADAALEYTDDAALFAANGHTVSVIDGHQASFKITTPWDLRRAEGMLSAVSGQAGIRTGIGTDVHAYDDDSELWLAGLRWPGERGLSGHSDGDPVSHAITDALLSAAGLGDIGSVFGTSDPRFAGAHGEVFLAATRSRLEAEGFVVGNVAVQIIGNSPRFSPRRQEAEALLTGLLGAPVSISATTTDGLGFTGRGEGVCAIATATVSRQYS
ncbi:2-C-methyl-D-erythritol 4-phosphate cytidylyltransferase [Mycetocola sp.]|jgi:2-C-methyl-D-erythritol 4-phosphate cytidylyltransferase/2-C-methyl-D-erythritol 2,4-cyclodiphosphate synthase|uniref:2-C-methyl-D-erythritol 4-phosphate cytidylyltransferase n=1 Tax=Mycetocola sp. TaxID=1871042 RepID=UPI002618B53E|nr:2-C-methyl-D-erythritol 4-phosphate cytidylyltransferase [Mycetocola sp.]MCU1560864.1 bifunctional 2-C-methyl-D-erythritol 4-phosphate cytidylyltransferase/2-C-methyl-D-erythritol [Mycetocola sp.]